ncbi:MAG: NUDIX domain-containing protein [Lachnospiraceae bacterium]|nr:NUDIX domain-containing protein [Lachnospiraceae bacterium]
MSKDMTVPCENGFLNLRVGAIIMKNNQLLMIGNKKRPEYLYSVGGRIQFGETAKETVIREVYEETGVYMEIDRLGFVHENYFYGDTATNMGKLIYEISFYFYMKEPDDFPLTCKSITEDGQEEYLRWIDLDTPVRYYPEFFRTELIRPEKEVKYFVTDER